MLNHASSVTNSITGYMERPTLNLNSREVDLPAVPQDIPKIENKEYIFQSIHTGMNNFLLNDVANFHLVDLD